MSPGDLVQPVLQLNNAISVIIGLWLAVRWLPDAKSWLTQISAQSIAWNRAGQLIVFVIALSLAMVASVACSPSPSPTPSLIIVGRETDFARGSVTFMELRTTFSDPDPPAIGSATPGVITRLPRMDISPVRIFLVRDESDQFLALYARDPFRGCRVEWVPGAQRFEDPCFGSKYSKAGEWLEGPSPRGLDRFGVSVTTAGEVVVNVANYQPGRQHP